MLLSSMQAASPPGSNPHPNPNPNPHPNPNPNPNPTPNPNTPTPTPTPNQAATPPVFPNLACYRGAVEACAEAGEWEAALAVWQGMQSGVLRREI